jgi:hypothetical protein
MIVVLMPAKALDHNSRFLADADDSPSLPPFALRRAPLCIKPRG